MFICFIYHSVYFKWENIEIAINTIAAAIDNPLSEISVLGANIGGLEYSLRSGLKYDMQQCGCVI